MMITNPNMHIVNFIFVFLFHFLSHLSIHDIPFTFVFIMYLLYFGCLSFCLVYFFDTTNILEEDFKALNLTFNSECEFICISLFMSGVSIIFIKNI